MLLRVENLTKRFPGVTANDRLNLEIASGEVHALLGENGAGKTTLMNLLYGLLVPDEGRIQWEDRTVTIGSPRAALDLGIGMVHQHFMLVPRLTVLENVLLGQGIRSAKARRAAEAKLRQLSDEWGAGLDLHRPVESLSVGERQRVEILKALYRRVRLLILDEPTASLTPAEAEQLFRAGRSLAASGGSVIFITHRLDEVMAFSDRITVLRHGRNIGSFDTKAAQPQELARLMVGHEVKRSVRSDAALTPAVGPPMLEIMNLGTRCEADPTGSTGMELQDISFDLRAGEIVGIAGVDGNGQTELVEAILGLLAVGKGRVRVMGADVTHLSTEAIMDLGVGVIPGDRHAAGIVGHFDLIQNGLLRLANGRPWSTCGWLRSDAIRRTVDGIIGDFSIKAPSPFSRMDQLSGGHQQRFVFGRALCGGPKILLAVQPTRGLDIESAEFIRSQLLRLRAAGNAVLLVSMDLDEVLQLSDRVGVLYGGRLIGSPSACRTRAQIGLLMAGVASAEAHGGTP